MSNPILSLKNASLKFGERFIFSEMGLHIYQGDKICLVGRNGEGKSTLLKILNYNIDLDSGEIWSLPGLKIGYLPQDLNLNSNMSIGELVLKDLGKADEVAHKEYLADIILTPLHLDKSQKLSELSGGQLRRAYLARALIDEPDLLMLDEPTNHLDIVTIEWLEGYLKSFQGAIIFISHDRTFCRNVSNKTFWVDRGSIKINNQGYSNFENWSISVYEAEQQALYKLSKKLDAEEQWKITGVTARRKRNQRRLSELYALRQSYREDQASLNKRKASFKLEELESSSKTKFIAEFENVNKSINDKKLINDFSIRIMRGDKIGIIGPNGCGKTTLLKLLTQELTPDSGHIKAGKNLEITYYDQHRTTLNLDETLWENLCPTGGDHVKVGNNSMHVVAYLKRFLFDPKIAKHKVELLSGGQKGRLMLAKILASPGNLLILDEPTNDLDVETLDMIQEILNDYSGTLLIVSHDRDFLDRIVTKTLIFNPNGSITEYYGSYLEYQKEQMPKVSKTSKAVQSATKADQTKAESTKMPYHLKRELELIPNQISELESEILEIETLLADPLFFQNNQQEFNVLSKKLNDKQIKLEALWQRWNELDNWS